MKNSQFTRMISVKCMYIRITIFTTAEMEYMLTIM